MIHVGILKIDFHISESSSLKDKRVILRRIKDKVRRVFNVSISEVDNHDKWQIASFGISCVSNDKKYLNATLSRVKDFIEKNRDIVVLDHQLETM